MAFGLIDLSDSVLCVIDIQERLLPHIAGHDGVVGNTNILSRAARLLDAPILLTEQYPTGLGPTVPEVAGHLAGVAAIEKTAFGCMGCEAFVEAAEATGRRTLVLCGIEAHVCVLQTALAASEAGYRVVLAADATSSRKEPNRQLALARLRQAGATVASTEMVVMEWLVDAKHPRFRDVSKLIR